MENYETAKQNAKKIYASIKIVWCPALHDSVVFNRIGFQHLIQKGSAFRPKSEQKRRFALLVHAKDILQQSNVASEEDKAGAKLWIISGNRDGIDIKIIVRQIGNGKKHFLSIYGKKQKSAPKSADS
jgi:predicted RNA binding protein YcfA (HicA-like mRNA interferase family)